MIGVLKKVVLSVSLPLLLSGCESLSTVKTLVGVAPLLMESSSWRSYSDEHVKAGLSRSEADSADLAYIMNRLESEYLKGFDKVASSVGTDLNMQKMLNSKQIATRYKINEALKIKESAGSVFGYCVNFDFTLRDLEGKQQPESMLANFAYFDKSKPLSLMASGEDFTKKMCGDPFYAKVEKKKEK